MALLEVKNLSISFGGLKAVDNFHVEIEKLPFSTFLQVYISQMQEALS